MKKGQISSELFRKLLVVAFIIVILIIGLMSWRRIREVEDKAETIADSLGVRLGKLKTVSESNYFYEARMYMMAESVGDGAIAEAAAILPGDVEVSGRITLVYYVK